MQKYGISVSNVISHNEGHLRGYGSNHADCDHWLARFGDTMDGFRADVKKLMGGTTSTVPKPKDYYIYYDKSYYKII